MHSHTGIIWIWHQAYLLIMDITVNNATLLRCLLVYNYTTMKHSYCAK